MIKFKVGDKGSYGKFLGLGYYNKSKRHSLMLYAIDENPKNWIVDILDRENNPVDSYGVEPRGDNPNIILRDHGIFRKRWTLYLDDAEIWYPDISY